MKGAIDMVGVEVVGVEVAGVVIVGYQFMVGIHIMVGTMDIMAMVVGIITVTVEKQNVKVTIFSAALHL
jgi:hypothetical protein